VTVGKAKSGSGVTLRTVAAGGDGGGMSKRMSSSEASCTGAGRRARGPSLLELAGGEDRREVVDELGMTKAVSPWRVKSEAGLR